MVRGPRVLVALVASLLLLVPALALGFARDAPSVAYVPDTPRDYAVPPDDPGPPAPPPNELHFAGLITFSDPTDLLMGHDPMLWRESCHVLSLGEGNHHNATLSLTDGLSDGEVEDLNLYAWNNTGHLAGRWDQETHGLDIHHAVDLPKDIVHLAVCLKTGARASYELVVV